MFTSEVLIHMQIMKSKAVGDGAVAGTEIIKYVRKEK